MLVLKLQSFPRTAVFSQQSEQHLSSEQQNSALPLAPISLAQSPLSSPILTVEPVLSAECVCLRF